jgi:hypothetical protein
MLVVVSRAKIDPDIATDVIDKIATSLPQQCARVRAMFYPPGPSTDGDHRAIVGIGRRSAQRRLPLGGPFVRGKRRIGAIKDADLISTSVPPSSSGKTIVVPVIKVNGDAIAPMVKRVAVDRPI